MSHGSLATRRASNRPDWRQSGFVAEDIATDSTSITTKSVSIATINIIHTTTTTIIIIIIIIINIIITIFCIASTVILV